ncbi:MAG TPA: flagellar FlbD family protein [Gaiellales bacterium]|nr:flagellar FlbD family protein [Gaiellales bacterium]
MIPLHRITQPDHELYVNPELIQTVEATPDTVISLTNGSKFVVAETPAEVARLIRDWRAGIMAASGEHAGGTVVPLRQLRPRA